ncbi:hypothetical protein BJG93_36595 (plasmid) [Paraburkholderia sprentiae WSM5005]|uniref:Uncharacterized protein n=1 Tax=Paraburkholderia sprentiae WSM5005 TaxID=754502 RepID=A0A8F4QIA7_9BURK|nr:hypothetical protein [Paraburkholderia sprentiae]QXE07367.1 hypothetical protein BJG93_36595 [Paraburkholderia sprentiae WSM5005]
MDTSYGQGYIGRLLRIALALVVVGCIAETGHADCHDYTEQAYAAGRDHQDRGQQNNEDTKQCLAACDHDTPEALPDCKRSCIHDMHVESRNAKKDWDNAVVDIQSQAASHGCRDSNGNPYAPSYR